MVRREDLRPGQLVWWHSTFFLDGKPQRAIVVSVQRKKCHIERGTTLTGHRGTRFRLDTQHAEDRYWNNWFATDEQEAGVTRRPSTTPPDEEQRVEG